MGHASLQERTLIWILAFGEQTARVSCFPACSSISPPQVIRLLEEFHVTHTKTQKSPLEVYQPPSENFCGKARVQKVQSFSRVPHISTLPGFETRSLGVCLVSLSDRSWGHGNWLCKAPNPETNKPLDQKAVVNLTESTWQERATLSLEEETSRGSRVAWCSDHSSDHSSTPILTYLQPRTCRDDSKPFRHLSFFRGQSLALRHCTLWAFRFPPASCGRNPASSSGR